MRKLYLALSLALIAVLTWPELTRPGMALTSAEAVDHENAYPNVGSIIVWRDPNNPPGLPGGLAAGPGQFGPGQFGPGPGGPGGPTWRGGRGGG